MTRKLAETGYKAYMGPELEFFCFESQDKPPILLIREDILTIGP